MCHLCQFPEQWNTDRALRTLGTEVNDPKYTSTQPAIGLNTQEKRRRNNLFCQRPRRGKGGYDIWYTSLITEINLYRTPINLWNKK